MMILVPHVARARSSTPALAARAIALVRRNAEPIRRLARQWGVEPIWVADTEPNKRFPLYTRGNVGEVFPHVMTALTGTLIGDAVRRAQDEVFVEMGVLRPHEVVGDAVGTGVFGGYLYSSGSAMRLFGVRMPGMNATTGDEQVFGAVEGVPPYRRAKGDRNLVASLLVTRYTIGMLRHPDLAPLDGARTSEREWLATMPDLASAPNDDLLRWIQTYPPRIGASMKRLLQFSMLAGAPRALLDRFLDRPGVAAGLANRVVGGTGDVDSAQLAHRLWALGRLVASDADLTAAFDVGLDGIVERTSGTPLEAAVEAFLADHGHRGNDEYELATPAWVMDPAPVYASIDRLRRAPHERDPGLAEGRLGSDAVEALAEAIQAAPRLMRPMVRRAAQVSRLGSIGRERAKDILVLENLGARMVLHELARRAADSGGPQDVRMAFCVTIDELPSFVASPADYRTLIAERWALQQHLDERIPPPWFEGTIPDPAGWPLRADAQPTAPARGDILTGIAVNGGVASGPARVIVDPADPRGLDPGDVLVCAITDPSWTPLFLSAAAVVCDTGAMQSHAAIVARELGIPAVLSVPGITSVADGTILHVDGTAGVVRIG
jgi:phosphohistidine swiveling domain-containing protein